MNDSGKHLTRQDWLAMALFALERDGVKEVRVERLARSLGVSKGSFYWHFKNRKDLLESLLTYWSEHLSSITSKELSLLPDDPSNRLLWLLGRIADGDLNEHDYAVRTWAVFDPEAAAVVQAVDESRLEFIRDLFIDMGFDECDADLRSRMSYYYVIGEQVASFSQSRDSRLAHVELRHALLTALPKNRP